MSGATATWGIGGVLLGLTAGFFIGRATGGPEIDPALLTDFGAETCAPSEPSDSKNSGPSKAVPVPPAQSPAAPPAKMEKAPIGEQPQSAAPLSRKRLEAAAELLNSDREIASFLQKVRYDNFFEALRTSKPLPPDSELDALNGRFQGEVQLNQAPHWDMFMEAYLREDGEAVKGKVAIQLAKEGKVFSNLSGDGNIRAYRRADDSLAMIVEASQEHYFQMYYLPQMDVFVGNYYEQTQPGVMIPKGTVRLSRG